MSCILLLFGLLSDTAYLKSDEEALLEAVKWEALKRSLWAAPDSPGRRPPKTTSARPLVGDRERSTRMGFQPMKGVTPRRIWWASYTLPIGKRDVSRSSELAGKWFQAGRQEWEIKLGSSGCDRRKCEPKQQLWLGGSCLTASVIVWGGM